MNAPQTASPTRERGGCLSILLVLYVLGAIFNLYTAISIGATNATLVAAGLTPFPSWYPIALIISAVLAVVGVYGLWMWKKWGAYAIIADFAVGIIAALLAGTSLAYGLGALVVGGGLLWYVLRDKWALLEG